MSKVVLITGCSTGIGRDLAQRLTRSGHTVVATARSTETLHDLDAALKLPLDVTQSDSVDQVVDRTLDQLGRIDVLVNNAGYAIRGAVEEVQVDQVRQMFDTNLLGMLRMTQAIVPHMRRNMAGRIVNISSIAGKLVTPGNGAYSATKFAMEAISDALRLELSPFGIQVVLVEPGAIKTQFHRTVEANAREVLTNPASPYLALYEQYQKVTADMRAREPGPDAVSKVVEMAIATGRPKARYLVGFPFSGTLVLLLGGAAWDLVVRSMFKIQRPPFSRYERANP